jgi:hypothetical protein
MALPKRSLPRRRSCGTLCRSEFVRDLLVFRPAWRIHEAKTCRLVSAKVVVASFGGRGRSTRWQPSECARWSPLRPWSGSWLAEGSSGAAVRRRALRTGAAVGLSTCAAYSRSQNQSSWLAESRRRLIWSVQTLDNAAMTENVRWTRPAPAPSLAGNAGYASATCDPSNGGAGEPSARSNPHHGRGGDHRAHFDG